MEESINVCGHSFTLFDIKLFLERLVTNFDKIHPDPYVTLPEEILLKLTDGSIDLYKLIFDSSKKDKTDKLINEYEYVLKNKNKTISKQVKTIEDLSEECDNYYSAISKYEKFIQSVGVDYLLKKKKDNSHKYGESFVDDLYNDADELLIEEYDDDDEVEVDIPF